jgi:WD40 repeat protein
LSNSFDRVQIIPGVCHDNIQISCLDCSGDTGKIAAAYDDEVIIFEPTPLMSSESTGNSEAKKTKKSKGLDYWWVETARIKADCKVETLSWNHDANRLLTAGNILQLWQHEIIKDDRRNGNVTFEVGQPSSPATEAGGEPATAWSYLWKTRPANPVVFLAYSADGSLFATAGANDRLVRVWYQNQQRKP